MVVRGLVWWSFGGDRSGSVRLSGLVVLVQVGSLSSVLNFILTFDCRDRAATAGVRPGLLRTDTP